MRFFIYDTTFSVNVNIHNKDSLTCILNLIHPSTTCSFQDQNISPPPCPCPSERWKIVFDQHRTECQEKHCVICCNIYYSPHDDRHGAGGSFQALRSEYIKKRKAVVKNYLRNSNEKNDLWTAEASGDTTTDGVESKLKVGRNKLTSEDASPYEYNFLVHCESLWLDVKKKGRNLHSKKEQYFDGFYINLLRQLLELHANILVNQREVLCPGSSEAGTKTRRVDLLATIDELGHTLLCLESAMRVTNGEGKINEDRVKIAMELYRCAAPNKCSPLGVLVLASGNSTLFEVYTLVTIQKVTCFVLLDVFYAPMEHSSINLLRSNVDKCVKFDDIHDDTTRSSRDVFSDACHSIARISFVCQTKAESVVNKDEPIANLQELTIDTSTSTANVTDSPSGDNVDDNGNIGGFTFPGESVDGALPAQTPKNKTNCCCDKYELKYKGGYTYSIENERSSVYSAFHRKTGRRYACKVENDSYDQDQDSLSIPPFDTETSVFMKLMNSPSPCASVVIAADICTYHRSIFMEDLTDVDWSKVRANDRLALKACIDITEGVAYLHELNMAHCDIKDKAVMVSHDRGGVQTFKLIDFNLSVVNADECDGSLIPYGTHGWSLQSHRYVRASAKEHDIFSLGILLATACCSSACDIVEDADNVDYSDFLRELIAEAGERNDQVRVTILQVALSLCLFETTLDEALGLLRGSRKGNKNQAPLLTNSSNRQPLNIITNQSYGH